LPEMAETPPTVKFQMIPGPIEPASPPKSAILYFNGFGLAFGNSDVTIKLNLENVEILELKASYTTAKTLAEGLAKMMEKFEGVTDHRVMAIDEVGKKMQESQAKEEKSAS